MENTRKAKTELAASMVIFGTIGIFVRHIPLPSSFIAVVRGFLGAGFVFLFLCLKKQKPDTAAIRRNLLLLVLSGACIGVNWILLFESYQYTTVATATLCYYMQPIFVILASPIFLKEKLTLRKIICVAAALLGMFFVSGILQTGIPAPSEARGILYGLGAAVFYAVVILMNQGIKNISAYDKTMLQLGTGATVLLPYVLLTERMGGITAAMTAPVLAFLLIVALVHTGVAYVLYFSSMGQLKAQTIAIFSYIDPIIAIVLSAVILRETIGISGIIGAILVLGATFASELPEK